MTATDTAIDHANNLFGRMRQSLSFFDGKYCDTEDACLDYIDTFSSNNFHNIITNHWSLLSFACYLGFAKVAHRLMDCGADINQTCYDGWNPLMCSVGHCKTSLQIRHDIAKELIRRGADVNYISGTTSSIGFSALSVACSHQHEAMAITLIEAGAQFAYIMDSHIIFNNVPKIKQYIRDIYHEQIKAIINDKTIDKTTYNAMAVSFRTTYAVELVGIIAEFII
ncbi:MAG: hypothetical protein Faunusvirus2_22 [Faunusvirus sp.]|jgi:hypothetical protein|uniref:Uncharacterized protein n=1 Tax=Faunusvirus sp. TaxID=2487766 RepID=A0A3G4ZW08_9VIRU|nr:MAG: hypothetical protein Faunusvirus2_22 [Faunusvirus sp.]